jgi:hypothetical protein
VYTGFWWGKSRERDHWGDSRVDGDIIKIDLQEVGRKSINLIDLAQNRD